MTDVAWSVSIAIALIFALAGASCFFALFRSGKKRLVALKRFIAAVLYISGLLSVGAICSFAWFTHSCHTLSGMASADLASCSRAAARMFCGTQSLFSVIQMARTCSLMLFGLLPCLTCAVIACFKLICCRLLNPCLRSLLCDQKERDAVRPCRKICFLLARNFN